MERFGALAVYGADAPAIQDLARAEPRLGERLDDALPYIGAEVVWAVRKEMARTVEDVLARRTRALFLNAQAAIRMAPAVASLMAKYLGKGKDWQRDQVAAFTTLATGYSVSFGLDSTFADGLPPARTPATNRRGRT
jgi:glycerol-3-phosphate dehydrogenase